MWVVSYQHHSKTDKSRKSKFGKDWTNTLCTGANKRILIILLSIDILVSAFGSQHTEINIHFQNAQK